jgi:hypothetical protein
LEKARDRMGLYMLMDKIKKTIIVINILALIINFIFLAVALGLHEILIVIIALINAIMITVEIM